ncbi:MAG TPA: hypothetical protein VF849_01575 [Blattabacteriaceae bacterium]
MALFTECLVAEIYVTNNMATGLRTVVNEAIVLSSLQITGTTNVLLRFYDGAITNVTGAYSNVTIYATNRITTFVGVNGITNNFTNTVLYSVIAAVAAATNNTTPILVLNIGANVAPFTFDTPLIFTKYVNVSNDQGGVTMVLNYHQP